jgi:hypothetical protein
MVLLVDLLLELVDELFQVGVADVVGGPVRDGIELDAVGELHVCFDEGAELVPATEICCCARSETAEVKVVGIGGIIIAGGREGGEGGQVELSKFDVTMHERLVIWTGVQIGAFFAAYHTPDGL